MAIPESFLQELVEKNDIVDVVGEYVRLTKRSGSNQFGLCPFHSEKTPSFSVSPDRQIYHCFGCGKGGGVINFIMEIENLSFPEAVEFLAKRVGMTMPEQEDNREAKKRRRLLDLNRDAARFFYSCLSKPEGKPALDYMARRQITPHTAKRFGLGYAPDCFYSTETLIEALRPLQDSGIPITVHMRQEGSGVVGALREMIAVARALRTPVEISHLKSIGKANWRSCTPEMLRLMAEARQEGVRIACDVYPYTAGSTQLVHVLPPETQQGGMEALTEHLADPAFRETLKARMLTGGDFENISLLAGFENIVVSSIRLDRLRQYEGQSIAQIAEQQGKDPFTCLFDLLQAAHCDVTMIDFIADEDDICDILRDAHSCVISDSTYPTTGMLHPRVYGTYTTLLEHFVREKQVLSLEAAVHKVTGRPAAVMGLRTKGALAQGMDADINIFDPAQIHTRATYQDPAQFSDGLDTVFVSGQPAILHGALTGRKDGTVLTR